MNSIRVLYDYTTTFCKKHNFEKNSSVVCGLFHAVSSLCTNSNDS